MKHLRLLSIFWVMQLLLPHALPATHETLLSSADDPANWRATAQIQRPGTHQGHLSFPLDFKVRDRRILFERSGSWDMSRATGVRFLAQIDRPQQVLEGKVHFKSGDGWYSAGFTFNQSGRQQILIPRETFVVEGRPAGWHRLDAIRFSFWPRHVATATVIPLRLDAVVADVQIVSGESRSQSGDERYMSRVTLWHLQRILDGMGLPYGITPANQLQDLPQNTRVVLLPFAPNLTAEDIRTLRTRVQRGTKLIAFENHSTALADLLGVETGPHVSSSTVGRYNQLHFTDNEFFPGRLHQHAWGFSRIHPKSGTQVIAHWGDALHRDIRTPAATLHANGAWFASTWRSGDLPGKQAALQGLLAQLSPQSLAPIVESGLAQTLPAQARTRPAQQMLARARSLQASARVSAQQRDWVGALKHLRGVHDLRDRALATDQPAWRPPLIGIWDQQGTGFYAGGWDETCRILREAGFTAVFPNMSSAGRAHYASDLLPGSRTLAQHGDQLQQFTAAAHKHGLEAHIWKICWQLKNPDPAKRERLRQQGRLMQDAQGRDLNWLAISHPDNVQFEIDTLLEILRAAPVDGIHLDYMRYPGRDGDYGPAARRAFEAQLGRRVANWPQDVTQGALAQRFERFRQTELDRAMEKIHRAVKAEFPRVTLSVAVWGAWPDSAASQGQDWPVWARNGWADLLMPMNYTDNPYQFAGWLDRQLEQPGVAERLVPGIGVISTNAELTPAQVIEQIQLSRERNARGVVLYRLDTSLPDRLFRHLRAGIFREP